MASFKRCEIEVESCFVSYFSSSCFLLLLLTRYTSSLPTNGSVRRAPFAEVSTHTNTHAKKKKKRSLVYFFSCFSASLFSFVFLFVLFFEVDPARTDLPLLLFFLLFVYSPRHQYKDIHIYPSQLPTHYSLFFFPIAEVPKQQQKKKKASATEHTHPNPLSHSVVLRETNKQEETLGAVSGSVSSFSFALPTCARTRCCLRAPVRASFPPVSRSIRVAAGEITTVLLRHHASLSSPI